MNQREGLFQKKKRPSLRNTNQAGTFLHTEKRHTAQIAYPNPRGMMDVTV